MRRLITPDNKWKVRAAVIALMDAVIVALSYFLGLMLRFDFMFSHIPARYLQGYVMLIGPYIAVTLVIFFILKLYHSVWSFASVNELLRMIEAYVLIEGCVAIIYVISQIRMPLSFWAIGGFTAFVLSTAMRFSYRFVRGIRVALSDKTAGNSARGRRAADRVMIVGAGDAGKVILHEYMTSSYLHTNVCCFIDDNKNKHGRYLDGVPIVGGRNVISQNVLKYSVNKIVVAMPSASAQTRKEIIDICSNTGCKVQVVPGVYQLVDGEVSVSRLRDVQIEDLLGRDQVQVSLDEIRTFLQGKVVMVTGGGGSIGSELCRQIAASDPKLLIIFDVYENNAYAIQQELIRTYEGKLPLVTLIGSVRNTSRVNWVMETYRPDIVFHAAAHKHVPLMEDSPNEAIKNNAIGTYKLAQAAVRYGVKRFVMISTDKAVNPTNIMGASKRLCEMVVQMMNRRREALAAEGKGAVDAEGNEIPAVTEFVAVRFGNVLGSNGSVIPLFKEQIAKGGPVTVTDKRIIRFFMTIPEAVSLVLQASYYAEGGEIFVLDMGDPVKIDDMARKLISLSGYVPDVDIPIVYTGLRPGEKLYEEMLMNEEGLKETPNRMIHIGEPIEMDDELFTRQIEELDEESRKESGRIKELVAEIVPTYHPDLEHSSNYQLDH